MHDGTLDACVLVTAAVAQALPTPCCCGAGARARSSWVLPVRVLQTKRDAGLTLLAWRCPSTSTSTTTTADHTAQHTQWFDTHDIAFVSRVSNANAALGRGSHEQPFETENEHRVALWTSPALGRFTVAQQHIAAGRCALSATAFAVVVKQQLARKRCHWCFRKLAKKAFQCGACSFALYCSRDCLDADEVLHAFQCRTLEQLGDTSSTGVSNGNRSKMAQHKAAWDAGGIDVETVRLTLAVLSMETFVGTTAPLARLVTNSISSSSRKKKSSQVLAQVAEFIVAGVTSGNGDSHPSASPQTATLATHVRKTLARVQSNAHPLSINGMFAVGVGMFPEAAMALNHSCLPNVVPSFDPRMRTLSFHAIRDIAEGEAVEYAYIELFQSTARRQEALQDGFGFVCSCWRCVHESKGLPPPSPSDNEEEAAVVKQLMQLRPTLSPQQQTRRAEELFSRHEQLFSRSPEMKFAYHTLQMKHAASSHDWTRMISESQTLMRMWIATGLPEVHPTMETLHFQVQIAAEHAGDSAQAALAKARVDEIRHICGFHPDF